MYLYLFKGFIYQLLSVLIIYIYKIIYSDQKTTSNFHFILVLLYFAQIKLALSLKYLD